MTSLLKGSAIWEGPTSYVPQRERNGKLHESCTVHESFDSDCVEGYRKKDFFETSAVHKGEFRNFQRGIPTGQVCQRWLFVFRACGGSALLASSSAASISSCARGVLGNHPHLQRRWKHCHRLLCARRLPPAALRSGWQATLGLRTETFASSWAIVASVAAGDAFAKGYGRFGTGYTSLATALGYFEQGNIQTKCTVVAQWLTFWLRVAMFRTG